MNAYSWPYFTLFYSHLIPFLSTKCRALTFYPQTNTVTFTETFHTIYIWKSNISNLGQNTQCIVAKSNCFLLFMPHLHHPYHCIMWKISSQILSFAEIHYIVQLNWLNCSQWKFFIWISYSRGPYNHPW